MMTMRRLSVYLPNVLRRQPMLATRRTMTNWNRPSPPSLPIKDQIEFESLQRSAQTPLAASSSSSTSAQEQEAELAIHPDALKPVQPEFEGDVNPKTGEQGGPKREPVGRWGEDPGGDWSFKGRVSDF